jgi:TetR/AcrR family transcriptional regulator
VKTLPEDLATKLLDAGERLPHGHGFRASIEEIAALSGVPRATLYYYFSGRDDLVQFFINDKLERTAQAVEKAVAIEGSVVERLEAVLLGILRAFAAYPRMCVELPGVVTELGSFESVAGNVRRAVVAPLRALLEEGRASGELVVEDPDLAAVSFLAALNMAAISRILTTGGLDADATASAIVPQLVRGVLPR